MKATEKEKVMLFVFAPGMNKKELIDAIASGSKLTKADAGRLIASLQKRKIINQVIYIDARKIYEGMPSKIDAAKMLVAMTPKEFSEFLLGDDKLVLIDAISLGAKLTKADAGRALDATIESIHRSLAKKLKVVFGGKGQRKLKTVFGGK